MTGDWTSKVVEFCETFNIPLEFLADTLNEPKVIPMIRGKAFEFSVIIGLKEVLPDSIWEVDHPTINAQSGLHDVDVSVVHRASGKKIRLECKLAKKGSFKTLENGQSEIRVKCMRSRTLGEEMVKSLAPKWGVPRNVLKTHNDQYLPSNFDVVITSIGNSFYETNSAGIFVWQPTSAGKEFLNRLGGTKNGSLKDFAFQQMYLVRSSDIAIGLYTGIKCTRRSCRNKNRCGFIPNYPIIKFSSSSPNPLNGWTPIAEASNFFQKLI